MMNQMPKYFIASLLLGLPFVVAACGDETPDDGGGGETSTGGTDGSGGRNSTGGGNGEGGSGNGTGGTVEPVTCGEAPDPADGPLFELGDCLAAAGPTEAVRCSAAGAFAEDSDWLAGWTNFSTDSSGVPDGAADEVVSGDIDEDTTWTADKVWGIEGTVHVLDGVTLTIEPGTVIKGSSSPSPGTLVISRGGKINAVGTAEEPIVFTSLQNDGNKTAGGWGGVILLGRADNFSGANVLIEGLADDELNRHGPGDGEADDAHDCGVMRYVRIEFGGIELANDNEINGLTMGSCGSDTDISYVQVNTTLDDGFEWFGGNMNANHLVVNNAGDDDFDVDTGWRGTLDTIFGRKIVSLTADPNGFEWDGPNDSAGANRMPKTRGVATNVTLCGTGELYESSFGAVLREEIEGEIDNLVVVGFDAGFDIRNNFGSQEDPLVTISNSLSWGHIDGLSYAENPEATECEGEEPPAYLCTDDDAGFDEAAWFNDGEGNLDLDAQ